MGRADKEAHAYLFYPDKSLLSEQALVYILLSASFRLLVNI